MSAAIVEQQRHTSLSYEGVATQEVETTGHIWQPIIHEFDIIQRELKDAHSPTASFLLDQYSLIGSVDAETTFDDDFSSYSDALDLPPFTRSMRKVMFEFILGNVTDPAYIDKQPDTLLRIQSSINLAKYLIVDCMNQADIDPKRMLDNAWIYDMLSVIDGELCAVHEELTNSKKFALLLLAFSVAMMSAGGLFVPDNHSDVPVRPGDPLGKRIGSNTPGFPDRLAVMHQQQQGSCDIAATPLVHKVTTGQNATELWRIYGHKDGQPVIPFDQFLTYLQIHNSIADINLINVGEQLNVPNCGNLDTATATPGTAVVTAPGQLLCTGPQTAQSELYAAILSNPDGGTAPILLEQNVCNMIIGLYKSHDIELPENVLGVLQQVMITNIREFDVQLAIDNGLSYEQALRQYVEDSMWRTAFSSELQLNPYTKEQIDEYVDNITGIGGGRDKIKMLIKEHYIDYLLTGNPDPFNTALASPDVVELIDASVEGRVARISSLGTTGIVALTCALLLGAGGYTWYSKRRS